MTARMICSIYDGSSRVLINKTRYFTRKRSITKVWLSCFLAMAILLLKPEKITGQSALGQLESMAGRRISDVNVPAPSTPYSNNSSYRIPFQKSREQLDNEAADHYQKALKLINSRNWDDAIRFLKKACRKNPYNDTYKNKLQDAQFAQRKEALQNKQLQEKLKQEAEEEKRIAAQQQLLEQQRQEKERQEQQVIQQKLEMAAQTISGFKKDIKSAQGYLKNYGKALNNNNSELDKWGSQVDASYNNVLENSKGYLAGMFIKYNLMGGLKKQFQKDVFKKMGNLMNSSNPAIQKWLTRELEAAGVRADKIQDVIDRVSLGGDLAEIISSNDKEQTAKNLGVLMFLNGVLETSHLSSYEALIKSQNPFGIDNMPGEYFEQAKMIGETYADLTAICYSWFSIRKLNTDNEAMAEKIKVLSAGIEQRTKEINCMEDCMKKYTDRCIENCTGKTRWSTPPPPLLFEQRKW